MKFHKKSLIGAGAALAILSLTLFVSMSMPAAAEDSQHISRDEAIAKVAMMRRVYEPLLSEYLGMRFIDSTIRDDCAVKNKGKSKQSEFCTCASSVTTILWLSGIDPKMKPLLIAFLKNPSEAEAKKFLNYQGPELYGPLCNLALGD